MRLCLFKSTDPKADMEIDLEHVVRWIESLDSFSIYLIFGVIAYVENILPPIPGDLLVAFGGYLVASGLISFMPVLTITTVASVFGFMSMYAFGAYFGDKMERYRDNFWLTRLMDIKYFDRGKKWMEKWGQKVILANRFLAGTRSVIAIIAGLTKTKIPSTVMSSMASSLFWNSILLFFGWFVHENWEVIGYFLNIYGWTVLGILLLVIGGRWVWKKKKLNISKNIVD